MTTICNYTNRYKAQGKEVMFVGQAPRFFFEYIYGYRAPYTKNDFYLSLDGEEYAQPTKEFLINNHRDVVIFLPTYPGCKDRDEEITLTEKKIMELGYHQTVNNHDYRIFER